MRLLRAVFQRELELRRARRLGHDVSVVALDLDRLKVINDTLGRDVGDALLRQLATRLLACIREDDLVARAGGEEFTIIPRAPIPAARSARSHSGSSTRSRNRARSTVAKCSSAPASVWRARRSAHHRVRSAAALAPPTPRTPDPGAFIEIAEQTGLIVPIGTRVLDAVGAQLTRWPKNVYISANVSAVQIAPKLVGEVGQLLNRYRLAPARLVLEITESRVLDPHAEPTHAGQRRRGVRLALDDFGTGCTSRAGARR